MRRSLEMMVPALVLFVVLGACRESDADRAQRAAERAHRQIGVRETPTVERVTIPPDSGRLIYDPPPDVSASNPGRPGVAINGVDSSTRKPDSARSVP